MSYRKHDNSKLARIKHARRVKRRKKKYNGVAAFAYDSAIGKGPVKPGKLK